MVAGPRFRIRASSPRGVGPRQNPLPGPPSITPGTKDLLVARDGTVILLPGSYGRVQVRRHATLVLAGGLYQMLALDLDEEATVEARGASEVRIKDELDTDSGARTIVDPKVPGLHASSLVELSG